MRRADRIDAVLETVCRIWKNNPDLRLLQLLLNAVVWDTTDIYFLEDDELLERLQKVYGL